MIRTRESAAAGKLISIQHAVRASRCVRVAPRPVARPAVNPGRRARRGRQLAPGSDRARRQSRRMIDWAFSLPVPERPPQRYTDVDSSISGISFTTGPHSGPTGVNQPGGSGVAARRALTRSRAERPDDMMGRRRQQRGDRRGRRHPPLPRTGASGAPVPPAAARARATGPLTLQASARPGAARHSSIS